MKTVKRYFITGLVIWVPLVITAWVLSLIVNTLDQTLHLLPDAAQPAKVFGIHLPGIGAILTLLIIFFTGLLATNILGQKIVSWWEILLARIPVVNSLYKGVKQISDTIFSPNSNAFRQPLLVQYPRQGCWTIAFLTGTPGGDIVNHLEGDYVSVYLPTTPNPTSGYFLMMPKADVVELKMSVDEALKYIISMGVVAPPSPQALISI